MGEWIDFTGVGEGRVAATVKLYADAGLPNTNLIERALYPESPVALRAQFGTLDNLTSSVRLNMPTRTSLYLYELSPAEGRYTRITGADMSQIRVSNIGTWMNDRTSSMVFVNHGSVSARTSTNDLESEISTSLQGIDTALLIRNALEGKDAEGTLHFKDEVSVKLLPGERLLQFTARANLNIDAGCPWLPSGARFCDADGDILIDVTIRPYVSMTPVVPGSPFWRPTVHMRFVEGSAVSLDCSGVGCDSRDVALAYLFDDFACNASSKTASISPSTQDEADLRAWGLALCWCWRAPCQLLPDALEVVVGDTAATTRPSRPTPSARSARSSRRSLPTPICKRSSTSSARSRGSRMASSATRACSRSRRRGTARTPWCPIFSIRVHRFSSDPGARLISCATSGAA